MLPNSNEDSDQSGQDRRKDLTMPSACLSDYLNAPKPQPLLHHLLHPQYLKVVYSIGQLPQQVYQQQWFPHRRNL
ncbi:hypothetical protein GOODEAATRI_016860 [Goodea atripinnis]|uniref:Uncharacterized protein n=1 Tax=Goodea atripinnis TaxID=208336 RepID=A0ABV0NV87_9TELE